MDSWNSLSIADGDGCCDEGCVFTPSVVVAGCGGAGCNTASRLVRMGLGGVFTVAINTYRR